MSFKNKVDFYSYKDNKADISPLILAINTLGENLIGLELGVYQANSTITILHNCSIKKLYAIDNWKPYYDCLRIIPDNQVSFVIDEKQSEINKFLSFHNIKYSGSKEKIKIIEKDSIEALKEIKDYSLDFIFFDATVTEEQSYEEAKAVYNKIKKGGYFTGHDANCIQHVIEPIKKVMKEHNNNNKLYSYQNCFLFKC